MARGWVPLKKDDIVDIVAPASSTKGNGLQEGLEFLRSWGLVPRMSADILVPM